MAEKRSAITADKLDVGIVLQPRLGLLRKGVQMLVKLTSLRQTSPGEALRGIVCEPSRSHL